MPEHGLAGCNGFLATHGGIRYILPIRCSYSLSVFFSVRESKIGCNIAALYSYPIQEDHDLNSLLYVGCSRARHHLIVLMPENADRRVQKAFTSYKKELTPNHDPATDRDPA
jgi:hypothetical protein